MTNKWTTILVCLFLCSCGGKNESTETSHDNHLEGYIEGTRLNINSAAEFRNFIVMAAKDFGMEVDVRYEIKDTVLIGLLTKNYAKDIRRRYIKFKARIRFDLFTKDYSYDGKWSRIDRNGNAVVVTQTESGHSEDENNLLEYVVSHELHFRDPLNINYDTTILDTIKSP